MNDNLFNKRNYCGETGGEGACTFDPTLMLIVEIIIHYAKAIAFYLINFKDTKYEEPQIAMKLVEILASVIVNADFNSKEFEQTLFAMRNKIIEYEKNYRTLFNIAPPNFLISQTQISINELLAKGEKFIIKNNIEMSRELQDLHAIILYSIRSACVYTKELWYFNQDVLDYVNQIIEFLNILNDYNANFDELKNDIEQFCKLHYELVLKLEKTLKENYGALEETIVNRNEYEGKSILVSGHNYYELERVLEATKNQGINVYTHDGLLNAHVYKKFKNYDHLKGHYQKYLQSSSSDFAAFKGTIFVTNTPMEEFDSFVRGRIFTSSMFVGLGISKIQIDDFSTLIETTKNINGFEKFTEYPPIKICSLNNNFNSILSDLKNKFESNEITKIFIIKIDKETVKLRTQLDKFINSIPNNVFVFATFDIDRKNFIKIDSFYDYGILYQFVNEMKNEFNIDEKTISLFISHCNIHTLSYLITLSFMGVKNIYLGDCSYFMINPVVINSIEKFFGIKKLSYLLNLPTTGIIQELYG